MLIMVILITKNKGASTVQGFDQEFISLYLDSHIIKGYKNKIDLYAQA